MPGDARDLARMLAARIRALATELLPRGTRDGLEWRAGSVAGEPGNSLGVHLAGQRAGVWCDFASGESGDALDLVAAVRFAGDRRAAMTWARVWLGLPNSSDGVGATTTPRDLPYQPETARQTADADEHGARQRAALEMFLGAKPSLAGTPAALYLAARGIDFAELGRQPRSLRFAPHLPNRESGRNWPAMVAAITDANGVHVATHRTWLAKSADGTWRKAPLRNPKMTLGSFAGGAVRLWRGSSDKSLTQAPDGETVAIAEGIETGLSVAIACPERRVLCAVSLANMPNLVLPSAVRTVILCADNDGQNVAAARAFARAVTRFANGGRAVRIARSPIGSDFNDALMTGDIE
jgi:hypothetical protein